jgi:CRP-like cAMP-binding protein
MEPFFNITEREEIKLKENLKGHIYTFNKGEEILQTINAKNIICIMLDGEARYVLNDYNGNEILIEELKKNSVFGTFINDIDNPNTQLYSASETKVLVLDYNLLMSDLLNNNLYYIKFIKNLFSILTYKISEYNKRIRVLSKKSIRDKILEYISILYENYHSKTIYLDKSLKDIADYICVNRSAMFREIKYLKEDRIISLEKSKLTILYDI